MTTIFKVYLVTLVCFNTILFNQCRKWHYLLTDKWGSGAKYYFRHVKEWSVCRKICGFRW